MNWKSLLFLPLAALAAGSPATFPRLKEEIPLHVKGACQYEQARSAFLFAYAYRSQSAPVANRYCQTATQESNECGADAEILKKRIKALCENLGDI